MERTRTGRGQDEDRTPARVFRPMFSPELEKLVKSAAGLAGMSVPKYLNTIGLELIRTDARARAIALADSTDL